MDFTIPQTLKEEHENLHADVVRATKEPGKIGEAARTVARLLRAHFTKEEQFALPALALLPDLARGKFSPDMVDVMSLTAQLKHELPTMLDEHRLIEIALTELMDAARKGDKTEWAEFAYRLMHHARNEEQVLYPAALLVGEFVKLRLTR